MNYKQESFNECAQAILKRGYHVFRAKSGTYGFYTDSEGSRVVSFQCDFTVSVSGNYKTSEPRQTGNGWQIDDTFDPSKVQDYFNATAPHWAVKGATWRYTTLQEHLDQYGSSSNYEEIKIACPACSEIVNSDHDIEINGLRNSADLI